MKIKKIVSLLLCGVLAVTMAAGCGKSEKTKNDKGKDTITMVWYPNESAKDYKGARDEFAHLIEKATNKKVEQKLTTDYSIAIEAIANGTAQICFMGAQGYIEAQKSNENLRPLFVNSGASGTLDDALYYSFLSVNEADEQEYMTDGQYSIDNIKGKRMSFVSNSSTSGFKVPAGTIKNNFKDLNLSDEDLVEGGEDKIFSQVLFGGSHQGAAFNLLSGKADVAAFCDTEIAPYAKCVNNKPDESGAVYEINSDAKAPFDTVTGKKFVVIQSTPVLNGPFVYNPETLSKEDVKAIQDLFTSDEVSDNPSIFAPEGSNNVAMFEKTNAERFVLVDDSWFDPIRQLSK